MTRSFATFSVLLIETEFYLGVFLLILLQNYSLFECVKLWTAARAKCFKDSIRKFNMWFQVYHMYPYTVYSFGNNLMIMIIQIPGTVQFSALLSLFCLLMYHKTPSVSCSLIFIKLNMQDCHLDLEIAYFQVICGSYRYDFICFTMS